jgi:osmotically-inducible protein OsmY
MYEQGISVHFLEVSAAAGTVTLYGVVNSQGLSDSAASAAADAVKKAAQETAGAVESPATIRNEIQIVHEYTVMP